MPGHSSPDYLVYSIPIIALIVVIRLIRGAKARSLKIERLWIQPTILLALIGLAIAAQPPPLDPPTIATLVASAVTGAAFGWFRGRTVRVTIDTETHALSSQQSPVGMIVLVVLLAARTGLRLFLEQHEHEWGIPAAALTDGFLVFFATMNIGMRLEIFTRARRLMAQAATRKAHGQIVPTEVTEEHA